MSTIMTRRPAPVTADGDEPDPQHERDTSNPDEMEPLPRRQVRTLTTAEAAQLDRLFREHNDWMIGYARRHGADGPLAEDIVSDTWLAVASRIRREGLYESAGMPKLLAQMTLWTFTSHLRVARNNELPVDISYRALPGSAPAADVAADAEEFDGPQFPARIRRALDQLPERWRRALEFHCEGLSYRAIGSHLEVTGAHAGRLLKAAAAAIRPVVEGVADDPVVPTLRASEAARAA